MAKRQMSIALTTSKAAREEQRAAVKSKRLNKAAKRLAKRIKGYEDPNKAMRGYSPELQEIVKKLLEKNS